MDFVVELVPRSAEALAQRVAALNHEPGDDAVKNRSGVERVRSLFAGRWISPFFVAGGETDEVRNGLGRVVSEKVYRDGPVVGVDNCGGGVCRHGGHSFTRVACASSRVT